MQSLIMPIVYLLVLGSGFTGLVYQVVWQKYLAMFLGSHASATALVLAGFFFFLAVGYFVIGRWSHLLGKSRLALYAWLELLIGAYALLSPDYFVWLREVYWQHAPENFSLTVGFLLTAATIGLPTLLMGGTIPVLTEGLSREFQLSHQVHARVYGLNTLGAFLGAVLSGFFLIEWWGLPLTLTIAGLANVAIFLVGLSVARYGGMSFSGPPVSESTASQLPRKVRVLLLGISFLSGFYVFSLESLIIRMAGLALGSTVYTYAMVVGAFILAIALGSFLAEKFEPSRRPSLLWSIQAALLAAILGLYFSVPEWPDLFYRLRVLFAPLPINFQPYWFAVLLTFILLLLIPVGLMGMNLPLLFGYLRNRNEHLSTLVGRLYATNCAGSVLGAAVGGYLLFNWFNSQQIFRINLWLMSVSLVLTIFLLPPGRHILRWLGSGLVALAIALLPNWSLTDFIPARGYMPPPTSADGRPWREQIQSQIKDMNIPFFQDDPNTSVSVVEWPLSEPDKRLKINRRIDLNVNAKADATYPGDDIVRAFLPLLATSFAPNPERVFIVGLGAGLSTAVAANLQEVKKVEVAEISQGVINALPQFKDFNHNLEQHTDKYKIHLGDAYQILRARQQKYDVILSEPSNPWITGVDKLFTIEFYKAVADRLNSDGVFGQWFPLSGLAAKDVRSIFKSLSSAFPYVYVWNPGGGTVSILCALKPIQLNWEILKGRFEQNRVFFNSIDIQNPTTLPALQILPPWALVGLTQGAELHSLEHPSLTYSSNRTMFGGGATSFDSLLSLSLKKSVPRNEPLAKLLIDSREEPLSEAEMDDIVKFYRRVGSSTSDLFSLRWRYVKSLAKKAETKDPSKWNRVDWIAVIMGLRDVPSASDQLKIENLINNLALAHQSARLVFWQPQSDRLAKALRFDCESVSCLQALWTAFLELAPLDHPFRKEKLDFSKQDDRKKTLKQIQELVGNS